MLLEEDDYDYGNCVVIKQGILCIETIFFEIQSLFSVFRPHYKVVIE